MSAIRQSLHHIYAVSYNRTRPRPRPRLFENLALWLVLDFGNAITGFEFVFEDDLNSLDWLLVSERDVNGPCIDADD